MLSSFRIVLCFLALAAGAWMVLPQLKVDLLPQEKSSSFIIYFSLPNSSPDVVEQQLTSVIEGACSQLKQLKKINSVSNYNSGYVSLLFDKSADMQYKRFELAAIIRQLYPQLPSSASYPIILGSHDAGKKQSALLVYSINAPLQPFRIREESEDVFRKAFAGINGIKETRISGVENLSLAIRFDKDKCRAWKIEPAQVTGNVQSYFAVAYPGTVVTGSGEQYFLRLPSPGGSIETIENLLLPVSNATSIRLKDIAQVYIEENEPQRYFRINGKNSVNLSIYAREGENKIVLGRKARELVEQVKSNLSKDFEVRLEYDDTEFLEKEVTKNYRRMGISASILVLFILLAYRSWRFVVNLLAGLLINVCLVVILAWLFRLDIHLYTIAGLAISFGIMIDNAVVMLDYYHQWRNRKVFLSLLAASLITIAALCLVFFLPDEEKQNLTDFALIIVMALVSSLITALLFTPALYQTLNRRPSPAAGQRADKEEMPAGRKYGRRRATGKRKRKLLHAYYHSIAFLARYRKSFICLIVLGFGLPVFLLPASWEGGHWYNKWYNATLGSKNYQEKIRPSLDKWLGGSLGLFVNDVYEKSGYRNPEKTKLYINAELPYGNTAAQLNYILAGFEKYLGTVEGIDKYVTDIYSGQQGSIEINFKEGYDHSALPYQLKSKLVARSLDWGGVEWDVYGLGQAFTNATGEELPNFRVLMKGYNYDELERQANRFAEKLAMHPRIQKINTNERMDYREKQSLEYVLNLDAQQMALYNTNRVELLNNLGYLSEPQGPSAQITIGNQYYPVVLKEKESPDYSDYDLLHHSVQLDSAKVVRIDKLGMLEFRSTANSIHKQDRQYIRIVGFDYMGSGQHGNTYLAEKLREMKKEMPVGYSAVQQNQDWDWGKSNRRYFLILLLLLAIFFICSVLFESLRKPFFIISIIPISFIGLFLTFAWGDFYFDQGGYAAFVMLGGLVANAAIFIVNDFNNLRKGKPAGLYNRLLIKATANRARTILLTTISTCCGLVPFLVEGQKEIFWFSLAVGTIGGLLFSLLAVFGVLPVLLWNKKTRPKPAGDRLVKN